MSQHKNPKYQAPELVESLKAHGLEHDAPSQLADAFRFGWQAATDRARDVAVQVCNEQAGRRFNCADAIKEALK